MGWALVGEATTAGKLSLWATGGNLDLLDTYLLFGDPATEMPLPKVTPSADLQVGMTVEPAGSVSPGAVLTYRLTFSNNGPAKATQVVLTDPLPSPLINRVVVSASAGAVLRPGTTFTWDIVQLASGASGEITVQATVDPALAPPASIVNTAQISAAETDPQPSNNQAAATTQVPTSVMLPIMHVGAISMASSSRKSIYTVTASTKVLDANNKAVASAKVYARWTLPKGTTVDQQVQSSSKGAVSLKVSNTQKGTYKLCVTDVSKTGWVYDPTENVETCDALTIQ